MVDALAKLRLKGTWVFRTRVPKPFELNASCVSLSIGQCVNWMRCKIFYAGCRISIDYSEALKISLLSPVTCVQQLNPVRGLLQYGSPYFCTFTSWALQKKISTTPRLRFCACMPTFMVVLQDHYGSLLSLKTGCNVCVASRWLIFI